MSYAQWFKKHSSKHKEIVEKLQKKNYTKEQIIDYFCYENMQKNEIDFCPLYKDNKKCHDMQKLNCYLCACPNFRFNDNGIKVIDINKQYSFCEINSKDGEQSTYGDKIHQNCTSCKIPHHKEYIKKVFDYDWSVIMKECFKGVDKMQKNILVIGAGGAGLTSALSASEAGAKVRVITKEYPTRSQTCMAQGGINASFGNVSDDSVEAHIQNTLKSAHSLADEKMVEFLCKKATDAVEYLDSIGVCFSRTKDGKIAQRILGGASAPRACYAQDYTGLKILHTLYDRCLADENIEILNERYLLEIITDKDVVTGAKILNIRSGDIEIYNASSIIIATGGYARIYDKHSTNSKSSTGDGIAVALKAGAKLSDMEFIQFHPTALKNSSILISESARGAGGHLLNSKGERFIDELLPRDKVARAIDIQMKNGEDVFLDIRHLGEEFIDEELPQERKLAKLYENIDPVTDLIPIKPVAHYTMGGIDVDANSQTNIKGLFAVGECANHHVHGANRLGGNSLLELIVFGREVGSFACSVATDVEDEVKIIEYSMPQNEIEINFYDIRDKLGDTFYKNVGIIRDEKSLKEVQKSLDEYISLLSKMGAKDSSKIYNTNYIEFLEFKNMLTLAEIIIKDALKRKESCGAHFRSDFKGNIL